MYDKFHSTWSYNFGGTQKKHGSVLSTLNIICNYVQFNFKSVASFAEIIVTFNPYIVAC